MIRQAIWKEHVMMFLSPLSNFWYRRRVIFASAATSFCFRPSTTRFSSRMLPFFLSRCTVWYARLAACSRKAYWFIAEATTVKRVISNERLIRAGYYNLSEAYEHIQSVCIGRAVYRTVRTVR